MGGRDVLSSPFSLHQTHPAPATPAPARLTSSVREQLQKTLGSAFTIERELGGGGMSQVFLAEDTRPPHPTH